MGSPALRRGRADPLRDARDPHNARESARAELIDQLRRLTSSAESVADALLENLRPGELADAQVLDLRFMSSHMGECIRGMHECALDALQACAIADGGPIEQVILGEEFEPGLRMLEQLNLLGVARVGSLALDDELLRVRTAQDPGKVASLSADPSVWEISTAPSRFADECSGLEDQGRTHAHASERAGEAEEAEEAEEAPEPSVTAQTDKFRRQMFSCCTATPASPLTRKEAARYDEMSQLLRDIMSLSAGAADFNSAVRAQREFFVDPRKVSAMDLALRNNPWAAAGLVLGILEADASLLMRAALLNRSGGNYVQQVVGKLAKIKNGPDKPRAQALIKDIEAAWAPAEHLLMLNRKKSVMLKNSRDPGHSAECHRAKLTAIGPMDGGESMFCSAEQEIAGLAQYLHMANEGRYKYLIPTDQLSVRRKPLLEFFSR